ncbi:HPr family phosphocarrier protein [Parvibaculum sp.]|uniref:HPr family phosphocarrier protein n=1 Tax=Parvibaculum sp. TaxID=2024848 RepID=UPI00320C12C7
MPSDAEAGTSRPESRLLNIVNTRGLHARASAKFVQCAEKFDAEVKVSKEGHSVSGTSIMGLMMLAAGPGCCILIEAEGPQAKEALDALEALVSDGFGERD